MASLRGKALALLARRDYSRAALAKKLAPLAESEDALNGLLDALIADNLLSDTRYATNRVSARGRRFGNVHLSHQLKREGVATEIVAAALAEADDENSRCRVVWQKKFGTLPDTLLDKARQARFLQYRGFSSASIRQVLGDTEWDDDF
ncbi:MAG: recombination regulator RecX [Zoogloeaceae bacterium]|jgi:regulatory protein|nr:recombination regulator RecX [Zoogloeaceae bacterium]